MPANNQRPGNFSDGAKNLFLAGVGAMWMAGEKAKDLVDVAYERGAEAIDEARNSSSGFTGKAQATMAEVRAGAVEARMKAMSARERDEFVQQVAKIAAEQNDTDMRIDPNIDEVVCRRVKYFDSRLQGDSVNMDDNAEIPAANSNSCESSCTQQTVQDCGCQAPTTGSDDTTKPQF